MTQKEQDRVVPEAAAPTKLIRQIGTPVTSERIGQVLRYYGIEGQREYDITVAILRGRTNGGGHAFRGSEPIAHSEQRCGEEDRREVCGSLSNFYAKGYLSAEEFERRYEAARTATYYGQFEPLFADLPDEGALR